MHRYVKILFLILSYLVPYIYLYNYVLKANFLILFLKIFFFQNNKISMAFFIMNTIEEKIEKK